MILPNEVDPILREDKTSHYDLTPEELAIMQRLILEKFHEVQQHVPLLPVRREEGSSTTITMRPVLPVALQECTKLDETDISFVPPESIIDTVAAFFNVDPADICGPRRHRHLILPRQIAMYITREQTPLSFPAIAKVFDRNHTTIMISTQKIKRALGASDKKLAQDIKAIKRALENPDLPRSGSYINTENLVILTEEGLFSCSFFKPDTQAQELFMDGHELGVDLEERVTGDDLWVRYGNLAYQQLLALENAV